jgi:hypothetical protein
MDKNDANVTEGASTRETESDNSKVAWVKPAFQREPLNDALSGLGSSHEDLGVGCS